MSKFQWTFQINQSAILCLGVCVQFWQKQRTKTIEQVDTLPFRLITALLICKMTVFNYFFFFFLLQVKTCRTMYFTHNWCRSSSLSSMYFWSIALLRMLIRLSSQLTCKNTSNEISYKIKHKYFISNLTNQSHMVCTRQIHQNAVEILNEKKNISKCWKNFACPGSFSMDLKFQRNWINCIQDNLVRRFNSFDWIWCALILYFFDCLWI